MPPWTIDPEVPQTVSAGTSAGKGDEPPAAGLLTSRDASRTREIPPFGCSFVAGNRGRGFLLSFSSNRPIEELELAALLLVRKGVDVGLIEY